MISQFSWLSQGHTFSVDAKVLDLSCYDLILGMEWLEQHSPMWVHWQRKRMRFTYKGKRITLQGIKGCTKSCKKISVKKLKGLMRKGGVAQLLHLQTITKQPTATASSSSSIPPEVQAVLAGTSCTSRPSGIVSRANWVTT